MTWLVQTNKGGVKGRGKRERREKREEVRRFTRFVDYGLMFASRRSFSLEFDLIRSPAYLALP